MEISVIHRLYNTYGGHRSISLVSDILEYDNPDFGTAIDEIEIILHFFHNGPAIKSLKGMQEEFHDNLKTLPKCTFYRKKHRLILEIEGKFTTGYEIEKNRKPPITINPEWVKATLSEIINYLPIIKKKLKKTDDFSFDDFDNYLNKKLITIPQDVKELEAIHNFVVARRKATFDKMDEWEKLGLDWEDYHPSAKEIVPFPFQWSCTDEFSPNGNDTGADTLEIFRDWNKRNNNTQPLEFLSKLLRDWDIDINNPYESEYSSYTYFQAVVGLAFASAKLRGRCDIELQDIAISAIDYYLDSIANETSWDYKEECQEKLTQSKDVIKKMP